LKFDLHIHSAYSPDSRSSVEEIIRNALRAGLQGISITDHNSFAGSEEAMKAGRSDIMIIPGAEYSTDMGHLLVYFLRRGLEKLSLPKDAAGRYRWRDIVSSAHEQGALVFIAHPFKKLMEHEQAFWDEIDGIEVYNSRAALCRNMEANKMALEEAIKRNKAFCAGSDGHWTGEIGNAFWEYSGSEEIKDALKMGLGRVWGYPTSRLYEPASQILKQIKRKQLLQLPRPFAKMAYACIMESGRMVGLGKKPLKGWLDVNMHKEV